MQMITYNNKVYSILVRKVGELFEAKIAINGAVGTGKTESDAILELQIAVGKLQEEQKKRGSTNYLLD